MTRGQGVTQGHLGDGQHGGVSPGKTKSSIVAICSADERPLQEGIALWSGTYSCVPRAEEHHISGSLPGKGVKSKSRPQQMALSSSY